MKNSTLFIFIFLAGVLFGAENKLHDQGFIRDWLISGPYPSYQVNGKGRGLDTDFLNGEHSIRPYPGMKNSSIFVADQSKLIAGIGSTNEWGFTENKTFDATWKVFSFDNNILKLDKKFLPIDDYFAIYAVCYLEVPEQTEAMFRVGSDDDHKIYLNGNLVGRQYSSQGITPDMFKYNVLLEAGTNVIVFKLVDRIQGFGFCFAVTDRKGSVIPGLKVHTDHPARKYGLDLYSNGCSASFDFSEKIVFEGKRKLKLRTNVPEGTEIRFGGKKTASDEIELNLKEGTHKLKLDFFRDGKKIASVVKPVKVYSEKKLRMENESLRERIDKIKKELPGLEYQLAKLKKETESLRKDLRDAYAKVEEEYAKERAKNAVNAPKSVSEKLFSATKRSALCVNGEWEASINRKDWHRVQMPIRQMGRFFLSRDLPLRKADPKNPYGKYISIEGFEDYVPSPVIDAKKSWSRTTFSYSGSGSMAFVTEGIIGKAKYFCNGVLCGEYDGCIGRQRIELRNLKKGKNRFEIEFSVGRISSRYGILGDLYFESLPEIRVEDIYVKPSWRKARLDVTTELCNHTKASAEAEIHQYAVMDGKIRLRLPVIRKRAAAGEVVEIKNSSRWADPLIWGIGGKYGNPDLYELVTDVYVNGTHVDRHIQKFGFREFWIYKTDFFLNGKRIILQGDTGAATLNNRKFHDVVYPLFRKDGINILRFHDSDYWSTAGVESMDRMGMLAYVQMYPELHEPGTKPTNTKFSPVAAWEQTETHRWNIENYKRWFRLFRNNPSVVIWSTDNEILTQAWDTAVRADLNIRNEKIGAKYEKFMKTLDPDLVMTRDGDLGTVNSQARWFENPPCDTANYHYPDFNLETQVMNWQSVYEYRPAVFGETLYYSYGAWDHWIGAVPSQVAKKAARVRQVASLYRKLEIPAAIYMGLGHDGFIQWDDTGKGNPWGITSSMIARYKKTKEPPAGMKQDQYPRYRIPWPALSGKGERNICCNTSATHNGRDNFNLYDPKYKSHVRNAVNDAYRDSLIPQPPLRIGSNAECIVATKPGTEVWAVSETGECTGVVADRNGRAWFILDHPGVYHISDGTVKQTVRLSDRKHYAETPGFDQIQRFKLQK